MRDRIATVGSGVCYYRGRFRAAMAWSKVSPELTAEATVLPGKRLDSEMNRSHSARMTVGASRQTTDLDGRQSSLTTV
jgi:hypothetical protein